MEIKVLRATKDQAPILANLFEFYAYDFSEFSALKTGPDGRFGYEPLALYWTEANRFPFLVRVEDDLAGFVLVQQGSQVSGAGDIWDVAEFFILRAYRRQGVGERVAHDVFRKFTGRWEVRVADNNLVAQAFWSRVISAFTEVPTEPVITEVAGKRWHVFSIISSE